MLAMHFRHLVGEQDFHFTDEMLAVITKPVKRRKKITPIVVLHELIDFKLSF